jgi:uncharacterized delta-60 repeat protein
MAIVHDETAADAADPEIATPRQGWMNFQIHACAMLKRDGPRNKPAHRFTVDIISVCLTPDTARSFAKTGSAPYTADASVAYIMGLSSGTVRTTNKRVNMKLSKACPKALLTAAVILAARTRGEVTVDGSFQASLDRYGTVDSVAIDQNGKILIGGTFSEVNGISHQNLARLLTNGAVDNTFEGRVNGYVRALQVNPDGAIIVGGSFSAVNGQSRGNLGRLLPNGALDGSFQVNGLSGGVYSVGFSPDGSITVGGGFTTVNGASCAYVANLDGTGMLKSDFSSGISTCAALETGVYIIAVQSDGKILAGGNFNTPHGFETLTRLNANGSLDPSFNGNHGPILYPKAIVPLANKQILVAGAADPSNNGFVRRLNENGSVDPSFQPPDFYGSVNALLPQIDGKIVAGGVFTQVDGQEKKGLIRLNADGSLDTSFGIQVDNGVTSLALEPDGKIIVGGAFSQIGGVAQNGIARLKENSLTFHSSSNANGHFIAQLQGDAGKSYIIESSADFKTWNSFSTNSATDAGLTIVDEAAPTQKRRFFRAKLQE